MIIRRDINKNFKAYFWATRAQLFAFTQAYL